MASRTYLPTLLALLKVVCVFISRHRDRILQVIGTEHADVLDAITLACAAFEAVVGEFIPPGD